MTKIELPAPTRRPEPRCRRGIIAAHPLNQGMESLNSVVFDWYGLDAGWFYPLERSPRGAATGAN